MKFNKITDKRPEALHDNHMPKSYDISLKAYGGGGTAKSFYFILQSGSYEDQS